MRKNTMRSDHPMPRLLLSDAEFCGAIRAARPSSHEIDGGVLMPEGARRWGMARATSALKPLTAR
jgi:hypothetical protein